MKKTFIFIFVSIFLFQIFIVGCGAKERPFGVFIGATSKKIEELKTFREVVIDVSDFTEKQISELHKSGTLVYAYLNIGSIENFRLYYKEFEGITLGEYENWKEERWVDVSQKSWQNYVVTVLGKEIFEKGVDGFFIDNIDVYQIYERDEIFSGINSILQQLNSTYNKPIITNGGYAFFMKAMSKNIELTKFIYGVNAESVYTGIDFEKKKFIVKAKKDREEALSYLKTLQSKGLNVYIIEYTRDKKLNKIIEAFYSKTRFNLYISNSLELK